MMLRGDGPWISKTPTLPQVRRVILAKHQAPRHPSNAPNWNDWWELDVRQWEFGATG